MTPLTMQYRDSNRGFPVHERIIDEELIERFPEILSREIEMGEKFIKSSIIDYDHLGLELIYYVDKNRISFYVDRYEPGTCCL